MAFEFPSSEASADDILAYQREVTRKFGSVRNMQVYDWEKYRLYPAGYQWLDTTQGNDPLQEPFLEPIENVDISGMPLPEMNRIAPILDGETARLVASAAQPQIVPNERTTRVHRSAKLSEQVLQNILDESNWVDLRQQDRRNALQFGTALILTGLELDFDDLENVPTEVFACDCGWTVNSGSVEDVGDGIIEFSGDKALGMAQNGIGTRTSAVGDAGIGVRLSSCPECGKPLQKRISNAGDNGVDSFGDTLFEEHPNHKAFVRCYSVYDFFPVGNGRSKHGFVPEYTLESIVPLEWLLKRHKHAAEVKPLRLSEVQDNARWHPSGVEFGGLFGFNGWTLNDRPRWCIYRITVREPFKNEKGEAEPLGRVIISANDTVLFNGDLMIKHKETGRKIPRYKLHIGRFSTENDSVYGVGLVSRLCGPQDTVNNMLAMTEDNVHKFGNPRLMMPASTNIDYLGTAAGRGQSDVIQWTGDQKPETVGGVGTHPDASKLIELNLGHMDRAANRSDISQGIAPPGVSAASAMMYLGEKAGEAKKPTEERFAERDAKIFRHMLEIVNATYDTPRLLVAGDKADSRTPLTYSATDLMWQLDVKVAVKPSYDNEVFRREATKELLQSNLLPMTTPLDIYKISKALGGDDDVNVEQKQQLDGAQNEWLDFMFGQTPKAPIVKPKYDDHTIHEWQHLQDLRSSDGEALTKWWDLVQLATEGWDEQFAALTQLEQVAQNTAPPQVVKNPVTQQTDPVASKASAEAWAFGIQAQEIVQGLPKNQEQRIFLVMTQLLQQSPEFLELATTDPEGSTDAVMLVRWLAHIEAHRYEIAKAAAAQMAMMAPPPAPGQEGQGAPNPNAIPAAKPKNPYN
jgi:hypothetical protein